MSLGYRARRRWALVILVVGLPLYILAVVSLMSLLPRPNVFLELLIYVALGVIWALPFRFVFRGIGRAEPDQTGPEGHREETR